MKSWKIFHYAKSYYLIAHIAYMGFWASVNEPRMSIFTKSNIEPTQHKDDSVRY